MGCNTSKEAVQSVEDSNTGASCDQQQNETIKGKIVNNTINTIPEIGKQNYAEYFKFPTVSASRTGSRLIQVLLSLDRGILSVSVRYSLSQMSGACS
jgi:hypothetical protein